MSGRIVTWEDIGMAKLRAQENLLTPPTPIGTICGVWIYADGTLLWNNEVEINEIGGIPKADVVASLSSLLTFPGVMPE